jgi:predicted membrane-bound spermidine synthase
MAGRLVLPASVFVAGMVTLAIELGAARILGNVFGTSNIVWANIIGLMLVYLSAGYFLGGRWADRRPFEATYYRILAWASVSAGAIPALSRPILRGAAAAVERLDAALVLGSLLTVMALLIVPVTLLGCVAPFAIRLSVDRPERAGRVAGTLYALSTLGSIVGTFLPVLWLIPSMGTARTFLLFSLLLWAAAVWGLARLEGWAALRWIWMPVLVTVLVEAAGRGPIKAAEGQIFETESAYNYIQVVERGETRYLLLNEGQGVHSVYTPGQPATQGVWDYFLAAAYWNPPEPGPAQVERLAIVGLAAGTVAKQYTRAFGDIPIDGWEIDPVILDVGRRFFDLNDPNVNAIAQDGRWGLNRSAERYSVIAVDAYRVPYIPWHLTTREFFSEARDHLLPDGVVVVNVGRTPDDRRIVDAMAATLASVFPSVHVVDVPNTFNTMVYATAAETTAGNLGRNRQLLAAAGAAAFLVEVLARAEANLRPTPQGGVVFTDDRAPIEQITNSMTLRFLLSGQALALPETLP